MNSRIDRRSYNWVYTIEIQITKLEDLSTELLYEIFEYFDDYQVYQIFFQLNSRFSSFVLHWILPIHIDLSSMSRTAFNLYRRERILPSISRIRSLRLSNPFVLGRDVLPLSSAIHLRTLILENIDSTDLSDCLTQFDALVNLHSLTLTTLNSFDHHKLNIYERIFRLPRLKSCRLSFGDRSDGGTPSLTTDQFSPIEHFTVKHPLDLEQLCFFLSYLPHLRRLSVKISPTSFYSRRHKFSWFGQALKHLTHLSLDSCGLSFDELEHLFIHAFSSIEVLQFEEGRTYLHAIRWQRLIASHLLNLRVFDLTLELREYYVMGKPAIANEIEQFSTPFWIERQWSFECRPTRGLCDDDDAFCSVNPYR